MPTSGRAGGRPTDRASPRTTSPQICERRDERDAINTQPADDAVLLDTTELTVDEVVERIAELVEATQ